MIRHRLHRLLLPFWLVCMTAPTWPALAAEGEEIAADPRAWVIPEAWRDRARLLVDPGPDGLPGGLVLKDVEVGHRITATYRGDPGALTLYVAPAPAAPEDAVWKGERMALGVVSSDVPDEVRDRAVARLQQLLADREGGWGWLRVPPDAEEQAEGVAEARELAYEARRLAWMGDRGAALEKAKAVVAAGPRDLPALLTAARALYRADAADTARDVAKRAVRQAVRAVDAVGEDEMGARTRIAAASAAALAGDLRAARNLVAAALQTGHVPCELAGVVSDLELAGHREDLARVVERVVNAAPRCDDVRAAWADALRRAGDLEGARRVVEDGLEASSASIALRAALARIELQAGQDEEAVTPARVAAQRGDADGRSAPTLAAVVATGVVGDRQLEGWDGRAATKPDDAGALTLGAVSCLARGEHACAADRFAGVRERTSPDAQGLAALHALALARAGKAEEAARALEEAWREPVLGPEAVAAEAALARARGEAEAEQAAWEAYLGALDRDAGPVSKEEVEARLAELKGGGSAERPEQAGPADGEPAEEPVDEGPGIPLWVWFGAGLVLAALGAALARRR